MIKNSILKITYYFIAVFFSFTPLLEAHSIVFVHIGSKLPDYIATSIAQARLFNEKCSIFLIANQEAIKNADSSLHENEVTFISCESLKLSQSHKRFRSNLNQDRSCNGLWVYSSERFFYLEELIGQYNLCDVFHLESDVMLYADLEKFLPILRKRYKGMIGATFENDNRCVAGLLYISGVDPISELIKFYPKTVHMLLSDMEILAQFKNKYHKVFINHLPVLIPEYSGDHVLEALSIRSKETKYYSNYIDEFQAVFDGAALGIYLAGWDSRRHVDNGSGTISKYCIFNPSFFSIDWEIDHKGRRIPFLAYKNRQLPIINLHITNKARIREFYSLGIKLDLEEFDKGQKACYNKQDKNKNGNVDSKS